METIFLDASSYRTAAELHQALKLLLDLPDYYGGNADALYDCLSERAAIPKLRVAGQGNEEVSAALAKVRRVWADLSGGEEA